MCLCVCSCVCIFFCVCVCLGDNHTVLSKYLHEFQIHTHQQQPQRGNITMTSDHVCVFVRVCTHTRLLECLCACVPSCICLCIHATKHKGKWETWNGWRGHLGVWGVGVWRGDSSPNICRSTPHIQGIPREMYTICLRRSEGGRRTGLPDFDFR